MVRRGLGSLFLTEGLTVKERNTHAVQYCSKKKSTLFCVMLTSLGVVKDKSRLLSESEVISDVYLLHQLVDYIF